MMQMELPLTSKQENALKYIYNYIRNKGYSPSFDQIQHHLHLNNPGSVFRILQGLEKKGYIIRKKHSPRRIRVTERGDKLFLNKYKYYYKKKIFISTVRY